MEYSKGNKLSVWFIAGMLLLIYGAFNVTMGIYHVAISADTFRLTQNPMLWWGVIVTIASLTFLAAHQVCRLEA